MKLFVVFAFSLLFAFLIEWMHRRMKPAPVFSWIRRLPLVFFLNTLFVFLFMLLWIGITDSVALASCITGVSALLLGYTNYLMLYYREQPFLPRDFIMALNLNRLLSMISAGSVVIIIAALTTAVLGGASLYSLSGPLGLPLLSRALLSLGGLLGLLLFCSTGKYNSVIRKLYYYCGADFDRYSKSGDFIGSFDSNGFLAAFFSLCRHPLMEEPTISAAPPQVLETEPSCRTASARRPHVLFIMSEAFSDPTKLDFLTLSKDPIPFIHDLITRTPSGQVLAPGCGGGTAHCEFEALTGFSTALTGGISPFENGVNRRPGFPSIAHYFKSDGYQTIALHPYKRGMYARTEAYPNMGIEQFIDIAGMQHLETIDKNPYVSDSEAYAEAVDLLQKSEKPVFLHLVTMQNHGDYVKKGRFYSTISVTGLPSEKAAISAQNYIQGIHYTDNATRDFLAQLSSLPDEVLVLFWGDHLPGAYPSGMLNDQLLTMYETPFFIWSNRGLPPLQYGTRSPMMLSSLLLEAAGLSLRPYDRFLLDMQAHLQGIHTRFLIDAKQQLLCYEQADAASRQLLDQLQWIQYHALSGDKTQIEKFFC